MSQKKSELYEGKLLIGGKTVGIESRKTAKVTNPVNGELVGEIPLAEEKDVSEAVREAGEAFEVWKKLEASRRADILRQMSLNIEDKKEELARLLTREHGKQYQEALGEVSTVVSVFKYYSEIGDKIKGEIIPSSKKQLKSFVVKEPVGVSVLIAPWNYPLALMSLKIAPALAAGCSVVVKPPTVTPLSVIDMVLTLVKGADIKEGTVNLVTGSGKNIGDLLINNPEVKKISFTGSVETGKKIMQAAASGLKKLSLELGGHSPLIVWEDADIESAVGAAVKRSFRNMGQICNSLNRIYVHQKIYDDFLNRFISATEELKIGDGLDSDVDLGPMVDENAVQKAVDHIEDARRKGAEVVSGGERPEGEEYRNGHFFQPTILTNLNRNMKIMREETFGPVAPVVPISDLEEAIERANDTAYGLVSYAFTESLAVAFEFAEKLQAGTVVINHVSPTSIQAPYGGIKESGFGREFGQEGIEEFLHKKHINIKTGAGKDS